MLESKAKDLGRTIGQSEEYKAVKRSSEALNNDREATTVLRQMEVFPAAVAAENERNLPFLATTTILMEAVKRGAGPQPFRDSGTPAETFCEMARSSMEPNARDTTGISRKTGR